MPLTYDILKAAIDAAKREQKTAVLIRLHNREVRIPLQLAEQWLNDLL
jgi:hypothetical protein